MVFKYNCHLEKHLSRKFPCFSNIPTENVINNTSHNTLYKVNMYNENDTPRGNMITNNCGIVNDKIENDNQNTRCYVCHKTFSRKDALDRHVGDGCKLLKDDIRTLELKLNKVVSVPSDNMSCRFCKQVFAKGKYLKPHLETCKKRKEYLNELKTELNELENNDVDCRCVEQPNIIQHTCRKCNKNLSSKSYKKKHEAKCDGLDSLQCPTCHKWFSSASTKSEHRRNVKCSPSEQPVQQKPRRQNFSQSMRLKIACEQDWKCGICIEKLPSTFQVDHIVPVFRGGDNSRENGMALCVSCHATKTQNENIERHK